MEIKATSKYDWETIKKFNLFHSITKNKVKNALVLFVDVFCVILFILMGAWELLDLEMIMLFALVFILNLLLAFMMLVLPKIQYKQNKHLHGMINEIIFEEEQMSLSQQGDNATSSTTIKYDAVWKIYETKDSFYIYINPRQAYIAEKSNLTGGTAADLRVFLIKEIGISKYKLRCKV